jgi:hypothetical protein
MGLSLHVSANACRQSVIWRELKGKIEKEIKNYAVIQLHKKAAGLFCRRFASGVRRPQDIARFVTVVPSST